MSALDTNLAKLEGYLARFRDKGLLNRIAGKDAAGSAGVFTSICPVDESVICDVAHGAAADIDAAATAAQQRRNILIKIAEGIEARAEEIAICECWDTGQAYKFMSKAALRGGAASEITHADEHHQPRAHRPGGGDHALEHALHAVHLEDRASLGCGLHGRP